MELSTEITGAELAPFATAIDWQGMMNYAAAVDDHNPAYFDDTAEAGVVAHPMYAVAVTWRLISRIEHYMGGAPLDPALVQTQVHHSEHLRFHRPMRHGDALTIHGRVAAVLPHRAGTRLVLRLEALGADGAPVFTEHIGGLLRGVRCTGPVAAHPDLPAVPAPPPGEAEPLWSSPVFIDHLRPFIYDGCADISFPIHTSPRFAAMVGLPGIILQGTATLAYAARELINRQAGGDPTRLAELSCLFSGMVRPGETIAVRLLAAKGTDGGQELFFDVLGGHGQSALRGGYARLRGPLP